MKISMCEEMKAAKIVVDDGSGYLTTLSVFEPMLSRIVKNANMCSCNKILLLISSCIHIFLIMMIIVMC